MAIVVSDTSPIRALAHIDGLSLLRDLFGEVLIPPAVITELEQPRSTLPPLFIRDNPFIRVQTPINQSIVSELEDVLDPGESEAIALALEVGADLILVDEAAARQIASQKGLVPLGVLGTLLRARQVQLVGPLAPLIDRLQAELGFFISWEIREQILKAAGE